MDIAGQNDWRCILPFAGKGGNNLKQTKRSIIVFLGPAVLLYVLVFFYPVLRTSMMSLFEMNNISSPVREWGFVGFDNYAKLLNTQLFRISMINIGKIWLFTGIATLGLAMLLALILTQGLKFQKFFRASVYLPNVIAAVAVGYMWLLFVFSKSKFGLLTSLFNFLGWEKMAQFQWLSGENLFLSMCIAYVFSNTGYFMMMYIAAMENDSALIEGANIFQRFLYITLPLIKGVLGMSTVLWTTRTIGFFALAQVFSNTSTFTPMLYTYRTLFATEAGSESVNPGIAAASAVVMTLTAVIVSQSLKHLIRTENYEI